MLNRYSGILFLTLFSFIIIEKNKFKSHALNKNKLYIHTWYPVHVMGDELMLFIFHAGTTVFEYSNVQFEYCTYLI